MDYLYINLEPEKEIKAVYVSTTFLHDMKRNNENVLRVIKLFNMVTIYYSVEKNMYLQSTLIK
jgi:hypothetical protein